MTEPLDSHIDALRRRTDSARVERGEQRDAWAAIEARLARPRRVLVPVLALASGLAVALLALAVLRSGEAAWYRVAEGGPCVQTGVAPTVGAGCGEPVLEVGRDRIQVAAGAQLTKEANVLRLRRGRARFDVARRRDGEAPFEVAVSHGTVRVLGTVFAVEQDEESGVVKLETGRIEFRWNDGTPPTVLEAGERLSWPRLEVAPEPDSPEPPVDPTRPLERLPPRRVASEPQAVDAIMQKQFQLRGQRRYQDAIGLLERAARNPDFTRPQRERFSFELGRVLQLDQRVVEACAHWRRHRLAFPGSEKKPDVKEALDACEAR